MPSLAGTTIDKYEMIEEVGCGGMAVVYRGRDRVLDREVAVKVLHPHLADRQESRLRLQREAIAVAKLRHDNILEIFDYSGPDAAESYIVTEFIHGPTLKEWIDDSLEPRPVVAAMIVHRLSMALGHAHKSAIVHRDIKPENVMIRMHDGVVKLMDFGIAQIIDNQKLTLTGQLIGSPAYMAPELISGKPLDQRTDLFSLGILLYQLATGELPFSGRNPHEVLNRIADGEYPAPSTICPLVDRELEAIIDRALATNPDDRFQSVETLGRELEEYCVEVGIEPSAEELGRYFTDPDAYVIELDRRVCESLMTQAEAAAKGGSTARAIRLLGRVVELAPDHRGAKALLARLRVRERRVRHLLVAAGGLSIAGLALAGYMLIEPDDGPPRAVLAGGSALDPLEPIPTPADGSDLDAEGDDEGAAATDDAASRAPDTGEADDAAPAETQGAPNDATDGGAAKPPKSNGKRPIRVATVPRPAAKTTCNIRFKGIPFSTAANGIRVKIGSTSRDVKSVDFQFETSEPATIVRLDDDNWTGQMTVKLEDCAEDDVLGLTATPKPAKLTFTGIPDDVAVFCRRGCGSQIEGRAFTVAKFPAVKMKEPSKQIELEFKHPEYKPERRTVTVYPGPQNLGVTLDPR